MNKRFDWNGRIFKVCYFSAWKSCLFLYGLSAILNYSVPDWRDLVKGETLMNWECKMHFVSFCFPSFLLMTEPLLLISAGNWGRNCYTIKQSRVGGKGRERSEVKNEDRDEWNFLFPSLPSALSLPLCLPSPLPSFPEQSVLKYLSCTRFSTTLYKWSEKKISWETNALARQATCNQWLSVLHRGEDSVKRKFEPLTYSIWSGVRKDFPEEGWLSWL